MVVGIGGFGVEVAFERLLGSVKKLMGLWCYGNEAGKLILNGRLLRKVWGNFKKSKAHGS
jgi:hypothetical protein